MTDTTHPTHPLPTSTDTIELDSGRTVRHSDYVTVLEAVTAFIPSMLSGHSYPVETIVGQELWRSKLKWHAGPIVAHAVRQEILPLRFAHTGKKATKAYEMDT